MFLREKIHSIFPGFWASDHTNVCKVIVHVELIQTPWWQENILRRCSTVTRTRRASVCVCPLHWPRSCSPCYWSRGSGETCERPETDHELLHLYIRRRATPIQWSLYIVTPFLSGTVWVRKRWVFRTWLIIVKNISAILSVMIDFTLHKTFLSISFLKLFYNNNEIFTPFFSTPFFNLCRL